MTSCSPIRRAVRRNLFANRSANKAALGPELPGLVEYYSWWGTESDIHVGALLTRVFIGDASSSSRLSYVNSQADSWYADVMQYGTTFVAELSLTVRLDTTGKQPMILTARGVGQSYAEPVRAAKRATENAVNELYRQVVALQ